MNRTLTVAEVAQIRGTDRTSAFRWLQRNAKKHMRRRGRIWTISAQAFALLHDMPIDDRIATRLRRLEETAEEHGRRLDVHAKALGNLHAL